VNRPSAVAYVPARSRLSFSGASPSATSEAYPRPVDGAGGCAHDPTMPDDERRDPDEPLDAREAARTRRRDHDINAEARDLMRPGMGKVFKQIQDAQAKAAKAPTTRRRRA
jgi:hypothetical protein